MSITQMKLRSFLIQPELRQKRILLGIILGILYVCFLIAGLFFSVEAIAFGLVAIGIGIPLIVIIWNRPEFGILSIIFLTSSFIRPDIVDIRLPIGGGFDLRDLVLIGMLGLLFVRELVNKRLFIPWWGVSGPLLIFLMMAALSAFYALFFQHVESNWVLGDLRILAYYSVSFIVFWSVTRKNQFNILILGLFIIADLTTVIIYIQQFLGTDNPFLEVMVSATGWGIYQELGGVRVVPAGHVLMHFIWFFAFGILIIADKLKKPERYFLFIQIIFIGIGHLLTYVRAQWLAMFVGFLIMCQVFFRKNKIHIPRYFFLGISTVLIFIFIWISTSFSEVIEIPVLSGIKGRVMSILSVDSTLESKSLQWREFENRSAINSILRNPIFGVGLGGRYRELTTLQGEATGSYTRGSIEAGEISRFTRYVHNSFLSITVKMGVPALIVLVWFFIAFLFFGWNIYQNLKNPEFKGIVLAILVSFLGLLFWSYFHTHLIKVEATPVFGLMVGLVAVVNTLEKRGNESI